MKAADGLYVEWVDDEAVVLNPSTGHVHYLNTSAALLYGLIAEYGYPEAMDKFAGIHDESQATGEAEAALKEMVEAGLLVDD